VLENLGVFFAQLPKRLEPFIEELLVYYLLSNGEHACRWKPCRNRCDKVRAWRLKDFLNKVGRECTLFSVSAGLLACARFVARKRPRCCRCWTGRCLLDQGHLYKTGGAASVARSRWPVARW
jgi:hypothetical protein